MMNANMPAFNTFQAMTTDKTHSSAPEDQKKFLVPSMKPNQHSWAIPLVPVETDTQGDYFIGAAHTKDGTKLCPDANFGEQFISDDYSMM